MEREDPDRRRRMSDRSLVLNASGEPLHVCSATRALLMVLDGKADVIVESERLARSQYTSYPFPLIVQLRRYINVPRAKTRSITPTKRTVLARDGGRCGYCLRTASTIDHILPRAQGGKHIWENVIAACRSCNAKKRDRTPDEAKMPLLFPPSRPRGAHARMLLHYVDPAWEPYLLQKVEIPA